VGRCRRGRLYLYFGAYCDDSKVAFGTWVGLWRKRTDLAPDLRSRAKAAQLDGSGYLYFGNSSLTESQVSTFESHMNLAIDDFIEFITKAGRLRKHVP